MKQLAFASLQVRDLEASKAYYTKKLGFELSEMKNPEAIIFQFQKGAASFAIRTPLAPLGEGDLGKGVSLWFEIDQKIESLREQLQQAGAQLRGDIFPTPFGKALHAVDPDGYTLTFLEPNS